MSAKQVVGDTTIRLPIVKSKPAAIEVRTPTVFNAECMFPRVWLLWRSRDGRV